jgi:tetratricopeptide (TPR) repeat protein
MGAPQLALRDTAAGLRLVEALESKEATGARAELRSMRAQLRELQGHPREAIALATVAVDEARRSDEPEALGRAYGVLDEAHQNLGEPEKVVHGRLALELYRKLGQTRRVGLFEMNLGHQAQWTGRWDEAIDLLRRAQADCSAAGDRQAAAGAGVVLGEVFVNRRAFEEAASVLRDARRVLRATGVIPFALLAEAQLARIDLEQGRPAEALASLTQVLDEMIDVDQAGFALEVGIHFASAAGAAGQPARGLERLDELAEKAGEEAGQAAVQVARVRGALLAALGRLDEAWECLEAALAGSRRQSLLYEQLLTLRQRSELARARGLEQSREELREAHRLAQLLGIQS